MSLYYSATTRQKARFYTTLGSATLSKTSLMPAPTIPPAYDSNPCNVVIFGETGTGKSSVVNLIAGQKLAQTSSDAGACTFSSSPYHVVLQSSQPFCIWDTIGLNEPEMSYEGYLRAIKQAYKLIKELEHSGGVHMLLLCIRGRITKSVQQNCNLFVKVLCEKQAPLGVVVTNLENEPCMDDWWAANHDVFVRYGIETHGHACITATPGVGDVFLDRYEESRETIRNLMLELALPNEGRWKERQTRFVNLLGRMARMLPLRRPSGPNHLTSEELRNKLIKECGFSRKDAAAIATAIEDIRDPADDTSVRAPTVSLQGQEENVSTSICTEHFPQLIHASHTVLELWRQDKLLKAIDFISQERLKDQRHHMLATRALLRARLRQWDLAIKDARKSITIQPTVLAYVAISMAYFGRNIKTAREVFNQLFLKCSIYDICFLTLIKALILFTSGHHDEGLARIADLIAVCPKRDSGLYRAVQVYMHVDAGKACMGHREYAKAFKLLVNLHGPPQFPDHPQLECISLMFGWIFDSNAVRFTFYQQQCEALYALGRQKEAVEYLGTVSEDLERQSDTRKEVKEWLQDFTRRCTVTPSEGHMTNMSGNPTISSPGSHATPTRI